MRNLLLLFILSLTTFVDAQSDLQTARDYLTEKYDVELVLSSDYVSAHNGLHHFYFSQSHAGIPIYRSILAVHLKDGKVITHTGRINASQPAASASQPTISPLDALRQVRKAADLPPLEYRRDFTPAEKGGYILKDENVSIVPVRAELIWYESSENLLKLGYHIWFHPPGGREYLNYVIDASNGEVLMEGTYTTSCSFDQGHTQTGDDHYCISEKEEKIRMIGEGTYHVFPTPIESPTYGIRSLEVSPADSNASPYGWHDLDGVPGAETDYTEGNNVHAFLDHDGNNQPDTTISGGPDLIFDFPFNMDAEPHEYVGAAVTNLFYMVNRMHDFSYAYGFDEPAGNFQQLNYNAEGLGEAEDEVIALSQHDTIASTNNATFSTPPDGESGVMSMFVWNRDAGENHRVQVIAPQPVIGFYETSEASFGPDLELAGPLTAEVILVDDDIGVATDACQDIVNDDLLEGKIAMIDRGECEFGYKVLNAENNGAIAVIVCNILDGSPVGMGPGEVGDQVTIPSVMITKDDCNLLRQHAGNGLVVTLDEQELAGPKALSGSFDNGVIAHEFGHGISNRLTGGPESTNCLNNEEQMGEGWSDFFALVTTVTDEEQKNDSRGIGNYVTRQGQTGRGIRQFPYSIHMDVNPVTYEDIKDASIPHGLGHVWSSMLWDLYWAMVDKHGFDPDLDYGTGGNNMAVQLVMDGMKLQPCNPGFIDGRDAIIQADLVNNNGENECLIREVFARRGLGHYAEQGDPSSASDGVEDFTVYPLCIEELKIDKSGPTVVNAGDTIEITLAVANHIPSTQTGVVVTDEIPQNTTVDMGTLPANATINGDMISFDLGDMDYEDELTITYRLNTSEDYNSVLVMDDHFEDEDVLDFWGAEGEEGNNFFELVSDTTHSGDFAWHVMGNANGTSDQRLVRFVPYDIDELQNPAIRFVHRYNIISGSDGGIVQISDDLNYWQDVEEYMFEGGYETNLSYGVFALADQGGFTGLSDGWDTTYINLEDVTSPIYIRFRYGENNASSIEDGWRIDDVQLIDMRTYQAEACITSNETGGNCDNFDGKGVIIEPQESLSTVNIDKGDSPYTVYPNPASHTLYISSENDLSADIELLDIHGRIIKSAQDAEILNIKDLSAGSYILLINDGHQIYSKRVIITR